MEVLAQILLYAKVLKELLTNKKKSEEVSLVTFSEKCLVILINKLPKKEKDPRSFLIPCIMGGVVDQKILADLGASINLMPCKIF